MPKGCLEELCNEKHKARGYCKKHYYRLREVKGNPFRLKTCSIADCVEASVVSGFCKKHYAQERYFGRIGPKKKCIENNCDRPFYAKQRCVVHYQRLKLHHEKGWSRFSSGKYIAKKRGIFWGLKKEDYLSKVKDPCFYCGAHTKTGVGLDRKNNKLGYTKSNVVACCGTCNTIKGSSLTFEEMIEVANLLKRMRGGLS